MGGNLRGVAESEDQGRQSDAKAAAMAAGAALIFFLVYLAFLREKRPAKTASADASESALVVGRPVEALCAWLDYSKIDSGPVFRRIDRWGGTGAAALDPRASTPSSSRVASPPASIRRYTRRMACAPAISLKPRGRACRFPKPCSSRSTARSSRPRAITTRRKSREAERGWRK